MKIKIAFHAFLIIFIFLINTSNAQNLRSVTGIVTSFKNVPVKKVKVYTLKSGDIAYTDTLGRFSIECYDNDVLKVSAAGFVEKKVKIGKESILKIDLLYNDSRKNFNDVVSHGHISEDVLKKAILNQESGTVRDYSKYKSIYELISSEVYSVKVEGNMILNKKVKSMDSTPEVLLVVDDRIVRDISYINPAYVRAIEFIEDVGATVYGSMGANGVLKITLK